ncbi:MAG TPA: hypothetical protein VK031_04190, partial [Tissierellaceae bacterium]|nr:hypothetical protein [Tissierellaceae bacterium]
LTVDECFMSTENNIYNVDLVKKQQQAIDDSGFYGIPTILKYDGTKVVHGPTDKVPISSYPTGHNENLDAPPVIWEHPISDTPPFGLYCVGVDPYRQGKAEYSDSLGAVYVFKRMHDIYSEKFQDCFVASYVARPDSIIKWQETARWLIRYYNARTLVENDELSFINYMVYKGDEGYLESKPEWLKSLSSSSTNTNRDFGISTTNPKIRDHVFTKLKTYSEESIDKEVAEDGTIISETFGMSKIPDRVLLEEMKKYDGKINVDRIIAASLAVTLASHLDPIVGKIGGTEEDPRLKGYFNRNKGIKSKNTPSPIITNRYKRNSINIFK